MERRRGRPTLSRKKDSRIEARICLDCKNKLDAICNSFNVKKSFVLQEMIKYFYSASNNPEVAKLLAPVLKGNCPDYFSVECHVRLINHLDRAMISELSTICKETGKPVYSVLRDLIIKEFSRINLQKSDKKEPEYYL